MASAVDLPPATHVVAGEWPAAMDSAAAKQDGLPHAPQLAPGNRFRIASTFGSTAIANFWAAVASSATEMTPRTERAATAFSMSAKSTSPPPYSPKSEPSPMYPIESRAAAMKAIGVPLSTPGTGASSSRSRSAVKQSRANP